MWKIYDDFIPPLSLPYLRVDECLVGLHWTLIRSRGMGMA